MSFTVPLGEGKYAMQYYDLKVVNGIVQGKVRIVKVRS